MPASAVWTPPRDWTDDYLVTPDDLNKQLRDNLEFLKNPPTDEYTADEASNYTTSSTSFVDVDATNLALTIETEGGDVLVTFIGTISRSSGIHRVFFDVDVDGTRVGDDDGIFSQGHNHTSPVGDHVSFSFWIRGLSAGSHTFKLQWKVSANSSILFAGAGTSGADLHPQFAVREVS